MMPDLIDNNLEMVLWMLMAEAGLLFSKRHAVMEKLKDMGYGPALRVKPTGSPSMLALPIMRKEDWE